MKFSEYILESEIDEALRTKIRDVAIKAGRKLGIKKAKNAETSGEKQQIDANRAANNAGIKYVKALVAKFFEFKSPNTSVSTLFADDKKGTFGVSFPVGKRSENEVYKILGKILDDLKLKRYYIFDIRHYDGYYSFMVNPPKTK